jgi:hypothetical protein
MVEPHILHVSRTARVHCEVCQFTSLPFERSITQVRELVYHFCVRSVSTSICADRWATVDTLGSE